jgi:hypothetical protein
MIAITTSNHDLHNQPTVHDHRKRQPMGQVIGSSGTA